jgi:hypothetical protein
MTLNGARDFQHILVALELEDRIGVKRSHEAFYIALPTRVVSSIDGVEHRFTGCHFASSALDEVSK